MKNRNIEKLEAITLNTLVVGVDIAKKRNGPGSLIIAVWKQEKSLSSITINTALIVF